MYSILLLSLMTSLTNADDSCPKIGRPPSPFDINKYLGVWYEIARSPNQFENNLGCVYATYSSVNTSHIKFENNAINLVTGERRKKIEIARKTDKPNLLKLKFKNRTSEADYLILDTDFEKFAVVFSCRMSLKIPDKVKRFGWILGRKNHLSEEIFKRSVKKLESFGIPEKVLTKTEHSESICKK